MHTWQQELQRAFCTPEQLLKHLGLADKPLPYAIDTAPQFTQLVTQSFVDNMQPGDPYDPLLLQVLPRATERLNPGQWPADALNEDQASPIPGLLHKYSGRVLLMAHGSCAINCRYCFRRNFPYSEHQLSQARLGQIVDYIAKDSSIYEVILSGGEPLLLNNRKLEQLITSLTKIPHLRTLRIHTRLPLVLPQRFDQGLLGILSNMRLQAVVVWHTNHAQELGTAQAKLSKILYNSGIIQLNQSVLLAQINDQASTLAALSHRLFDLQILPYYLHLLDRVMGTAEFLVTDQQAQTIYQQLQARLSGYLVPRLVREEANNRQGKTQVY